MFNQNLLFTNFFSIIRAIIDAQPDLITEIEQATGNQKSPPQFLTTSLFRKHRSPRSSFQNAFDGSAEFATRRTGHECKEQSRLHGASIVCHTRRYWHDHHDLFLRLQHECTRRQRKHGSSHCSLEKQFSRRAFAFVPRLRSQHSQQSSGDAETFGCETEWVSQHL